MIIRSKNFRVRRYASSRNPRTIFQHVLSITSKKKSQINCTEYSENPINPFQKILGNLFSVCISMAPHAIFFFEFVGASGFFSIEPNWDSLKKIRNYYIDPSCYAFKNYFSAKKNSIELIDYKKIKKPYWLKLYLLYKFKNKNWNFLSFLIVSIFYIASNPITSFINLFQWIYGRILLMKYNHSQLYFLKNNKVKTHVLMYVKKNFTNSYFRGINCIDKSFFLKNIYFRFYTNNNKFMFFKFIFDFFLFFISLSKRFTYEKMSFCYTLDKTNKFKTCDIVTTNKNQILSDIVEGIKQIDN